MYIDTLSNIVERFHQYMARNMAFCSSHPAARVSAFWKEHFNDRVNFPSLQEFMVFRRSDFLYGIGDTKQSDLAQKNKEYGQMIDTMRLFVPDQFFISLREPDFGAPIVLSKNGITHSTSFVMNAGTTWRIKTIVDKFLSENRPLNVCEIGAGWGGCAYQLHQVMPVENYTVIDLPENLCLSSAFLGTTLADRSVCFVDCAATDKPPRKTNTLYFALPPVIDHLEGKYDAIINTVSFQEMNRETVATYFDWASTVLAEGGVLISFNSHDKAGITRPSEYCIESLELVHLQTFRKVPTGFFNTIPYEMVFTKRGKGGAGYLHECVDALGEMMQLGLDGNLANMCERTLSGELNSFEVKYLKLVRDFFYATDSHSRKNSIKALEADRISPVSLFLLGNYKFLLGDFTGAEGNLHEACALGLSDFAQVRALTMLAIVYQLTGKWEHPKEVLLNKLRDSAGGLYEETEALINAGNFSAIQRHIGRILDLPVSGKHLPRLIHKAGMPTIRRWASKLRKGI